MKRLGRTTVGSLTNVNQDKSVWLRNTQPCDNLQFLREECQESSPTCQKSLLKQLSGNNVSIKKKNIMKENIYFNNLSMALQLLFQLKPDILGYYTTKLKTIITTFLSILFSPLFCGAKTKLTVEKEKVMPKKTLILC